jgi:hypothetical protein
MKVSLPVSRAIWSALIVAAGLGAGPVARGLGGRADYPRAAGMRAASAQAVFRERLAAHWLPGRAVFWSAVSTGCDRREMVWVEAEKGGRRPAFDHRRLAQALQPAGIDHARPDWLDLSKLEWTESHGLRFTTAGRPGPAAPGNHDLRVVAPAASRRTGAEPSLRCTNRTAGIASTFTTPRATG